MCAIYERISSARKGALTLDFADDSRAGRADYSNRGPEALTRPLRSRGDRLLREDKNSAAAIRERRCRSEGDVAPIRIGRKDADDWAR